MDPVRRFEQAIKLGPMARLRLRAEILLEYAANGEIALTPADLERLDRITVAPRPEDAPFLAAFDRYLEE
jgi:hypothetical protein